MTTKLAFRPRGTPPGPPQNVEEHISQALAKVPNISSRQRTALTHVLMAMCRDIDFLRQLTAAAKAIGPWSQAAVSDEGRPL
jgi:hypothetical protein